MSSGRTSRSASASVVSKTDESMIIEVRVEVETSADSVVVHLALRDEDPITLPMLERLGDVQRGGDGIDPAVQVLDHEHVDVANAASAGAVQCLVSGWSACRVANSPILRPTLTPVSMAKRK